MKRLEREEWAVLGLLAVWSVVPLAVMLLLPGRGVFLGSDFLGAVDQLQYLAMIRDSSQHLLVANRFDLAPDPRLYLHPLFAISGLLVRAGVDIRLAYQLWKPLAVVVLFAGTALYARRRLHGRRARLVAVLLGLFYFPPTLSLLVLFGGLSGRVFRSAFFYSLETFPASALWGYLPQAIVAGLVPIGFLAVEDHLAAAEGRGSRRSLPVAAGAALLASWMHPWQGLTMVVAVVALALWGRFRGRHLALVVVAAAGLAPLLYYAVLRAASPAWARVSAPNALPRLSPYLLLVLAPLVLAALPGLLRRPDGAGERLLRLWPAAALVVYLLTPGGFIYHAFFGLSIPLAVLAVDGWRRVNLNPSAGLALAAVVLCLAPLPLALRYRDALQQPSEHYITPDEAAALAYLAANPAPGGVLTTPQLGRAVPAFADRQTWVGHPTWTPDYAERQRTAASLFGDATTPDARRRGVAATGARFVVLDCPAAPAVASDLAPLTNRVATFGCVTVLEVRPG